MAVKFCAVAMVNLSKPDAPKKYYARTVSSGEVHLRALSKDIARESIVSPADVVAVLEGLLTVLPMHLANGVTFQFGPFRLFQFFYYGRRAGGRGQSNGQEY